MRIYAFSDCHLGITSNYEAFHRFLDQVERHKPDLLLGVGDVIELAWRTWDDVQGWEPSHTACEHLRRVASRVPTKLIRGNHDATLADYKDKLEPIVVEPGDSLLLNGILFTHGHQWDPIARNLWDPLLRTALKRLVPQVYLRLYGTPSELKKVDEERYNYIVWRIHRNAYQGTGDQNVVFGHTHAPMNAEFSRQKVVANCGDFIDSCSYLEFQDGVFWLHWI